MDESGGLENRYGASHRGFESYSHRHFILERCGVAWTKAAVLAFNIGRYGANHRGFKFTFITMRRGAGVVELDCLLSSYGVSHRGFESHPLRFNSYLFD